MSSIAEPLRALIRVQELDRSLLDLAARRRTRHEAVETKAKQLARDESELAQLTEQATQVQRTIRTKEQEADEAKRKIAELSAKRDSASSARMLKAVASELDASEQVQENAETAALEHMEALDELQARISELAEQLDAQRTELEQRRAKLATEMEQNDEQAAQLRAERESTVEQVPPKVREQYARLGSKHPKDALVTFDDNGICEGCSTKLPPDVLRRVRAQTEWVSCPSCGRLLYDAVAAAAGDSTSG